MPKILPITRNICNVPIMRIGLFSIPVFFTIAHLASAETQQPDFSAGLEMLAKLALPEMKGAVWIKQNHKNTESFTRSYEFREINATLSGNTWKLAKDNSSYLDFGGNSIIQGPSKSTPSEEKKSEEDSGILGKMLRNYQKENPEPEKPEKPQPESLAANDAKKLATALAKPSSMEEIESDLEYGSSELPARILLFAAQLHAAGDTESANTVSSAIFAAAPDDTILIDKTISYLADAEYNTTANRFFASYDWERYELEIRKLLEKYPRGWGNAPALAMLASNLEKRSSNPPTPSLTDITISPEAIALLDQLLENNSSATSDEELAKANGYDLKRYTPSQRESVIRMLRSQQSGLSQNDSSIWLFSIQKISEKSSPIEKIKAMRMDGIIALASVALDETLIPFPNASNQRSYYYGSSSSLAENIRTRYSNLSRPSSRGEIASALLTSVVPDSSDDRYSSNAPDPAATQAAAIDFWKKHRDKSDIELAVIYIQQGSQYQKRFALDFLSSSKDPKAIPTFESAILNSDSPIEHISFVSQYLTKRKKSAKPFADAYIKLIKDNPPTDNELNRTSNGWEIREAGGIDAYLKKLSVLVGDVSLSKLIASALKKSSELAEEENDETQSPIAALASTIQTIPLEECMIAFGKAAPATTPKQWMEICQVLYTRTYYESRNSDSSAEKPSATPSKEILDIWKPLVTKTDPLPESAPFSKTVSAYGAKTIGDASAFILEISTTPSTNHSLNDFGQLEGDGTAIMKFIRQRVDAYINSTTPEPWPADATVSDQRRDEITQKISELPATEIIPYAKSLPLAERYSLMKFVQQLGYKYGHEEAYDGFAPAPDDEPEKPPTVPKGLLELKNTIVSLDPIFRSDHNPDLVPTLGFAIGDKITTASLTRLTKHLLENAKKTSGTTISIYPAAMSLGTTIYASQLTDFSPEKLSDTYFPHIASNLSENTDHDAYVIFFSQGISQTLALKDGKLIPVSNDDEEEDNEQSLANFDKFLAQNQATLPIIYLAVLSAEDAKKINGSEKDPFSR